MNIGFDTNTILSAPSGAATYFLELLPALLEQAQEVEQLFVFSADEEDAEPLPFLLRNEQLHGVNAPFGTGKLWRSLRFPAVERLVKNERFDGTLDVCHSLNPPLMPSRSSKRVVTLHGVSSDEPMVNGLKRSLRQADIVITPSRKLSEELQRGFMEASPKTEAEQLAERFHVIAPGVNERYLEPPKRGIVEMLCQKFPLLEEPYLLAAGAAAEPTKSVPLLARAYVEAYSEDDTLPALLFVASEEQVKPVAAALAEYEGMEGKLVVMEEVTTDELPALYTGSEFLLHPGLDYTYGYSVLEAASIGVPAIAGSRCGALELLGSSLVVPAEDEAASWAKAILDLHRNPELRETRSNEAQVRARTTSWSTVAQRHWELYR